MSNKSFSVVISRPPSRSSTRRGTSIRSTPLFQVHSFQPSTPGFDPDHTFQNPFFPTPQTPLQRQSKELLLHLRTPYGIEDGERLFPKLILQMSGAVTGNLFEEYYEQSMGRALNRRKTVDTNKTNLEDNASEMRCALTICANPEIIGSQFIITLVPASIPPDGFTEVDSLDVTHYHLSCLERLIILPSPDILANLTAPPRSFFTQTINPLDFRSAILFKTFTLHQTTYYNEIRAERARIAETQTSKAVRKRLLEENIIHLDTDTPKIKKAKSVASLKSEAGNTERASLTRNTPIHDDTHIFKTPQRPASRPKSYLKTPTPARTAHISSANEPQTPTPVRTLFPSAAATEKPVPGPARLTFAGPSANDAVTYHPAVPADYFLDEGVDWKAERYWRKEMSDWIWQCEETYDGEEGVPGGVRFAVSRLFDPERLWRRQVEVKEELEKMALQRNKEGERNKTESRRVEEEDIGWDEDLVKDVDMDTGSEENQESEVEEMDETE